MLQYFLNMALQVEILYLSVKREMKIWQMLVGVISRKVNGKMGKDLKIEH